MCTVMHCFTYRDNLIYNNEENVDIKFIAYDAFLVKPSSGTLKIERLELKQNNLRVFRSNKTKMSK